METANFRLGLRQLVERNVVAAVATLRREPTKSPCYVEAQGNLALGLVQQREFQEAEGVIRLVKPRFRDECRHIPSIVQFERTLGDSLVGQGKADEAVQQLRNALATADILSKEHPDLTEKLSREIVHVKNSLAIAYLQLRRDNHDVVSARDQLVEARELILKYPDECMVGYAQLYATLAEANRLLNNKLESDLALKEGLRIATQTKDDDQTARFLQTAIRLGSDIVDEGEIGKTMEWMVKVAEQSGDLKRAHLRCVIAAQTAESYQTIDLGLDFVQRARNIEAKIEQVPFQFAALRTAHARLLQAAGKIDRAVAALLEGCFFWYEFIANKFRPLDFQTNAARLHEDFRLASSLLFENRQERDAFFVLEAGRSLHHASQVDESFLQRSISVNPFTIDGQIRGDRFEAIIDTIPSDSCAVTLGIYPQLIVAFVICANGIKSTSVNVSDGLTDGIIRLRYELENGGAEAVVPSELITLANQIAELTNGRKICGFTPHSLLHEVPWRTLLKAAGMNWEQLAFAAGYSFLLRDSPRQRNSQETVVAIAHGASVDGTIDFSDEADEFCDALTIQPRCIRNATPANARDALRTADTVFISCHGRKVAGDLQLLLSANGNVDSTEVSIGDLIDGPIDAKLVILSACESGVYFVAEGDFPVGGVPTLIRAGVERCIGTRFPIRAAFARNFFVTLAQRMTLGSSIEESFAASLEQVSNDSGVEFWRDIACIDLFGET